MKLLYTIWRKTSQLFSSFLNNMDDDLEPEVNASLLHRHFQQTANERITKYEKLIDDSFECLLSRLKDTEDMTLSNGGRKFDEFSLVRRKEFVKKVNIIKDIIRNEFRSDVAKLISSKYSSINTSARNFSSESFEEMIQLFNQLKLDNALEIDHKMYFDMIDLFENLNLSSRDSSADLIDLLERLTLSSINTSVLNDCSDVGNHYESERDVSEIPRDINIIEHTSDDDLTCETKVDEVTSDEEKISVETHFKCGDFRGVEKDESKDYAKEMVQNRGFNVVNGTSDCENEFDTIIDDQKNINVETHNSIIEEEPLSETESGSEGNFITDETDTLVVELVPKTLSEELSLSSFSKKICFVTASNLKNAAVAFTNFIVDRRLITVESRLTEKELESLYEQYRTEVKPEISIADQVFNILQSNDIIKIDSTYSDKNNYKVEFKEIFFLNRCCDLKVRPAETVRFKGDVLRTLNAGYFTRLALFQCSVCKDCFQTKDKFDDHNISEMHILKTIYLRDRSWFEKEVDYLQIKGVPDLSLGLKETENCEITLTNVSQDGGKIYIWKVFELVYRGEAMYIEYGSNYCLQRGESFKIKMRVRYTSIVISETLYPIVLKTSKNDINHYNYILIEPHFKVVRNNKRITCAVENLRINKPLLKTQSNNRRCIIAESSELSQHLISNAFSAFHTNDRNVSIAASQSNDRSSLSATGNWRVKKDISVNDKKKLRFTLETENYKELLEAPRISREIKIPKLNLPENQIPPYLQALLKYKFHTSDFKWSRLEKELLKNIKKLICEKDTKKILHNKDGLAEHNYLQRFHNIMWIEEYEALEEMRSFAQYDIDLLTDRLSENLIGIALPGLAEGRPSLLKGDFIIIKSKSSDFPFGFKKCEGRVQLIEEKAAYVKLNKIFYIERYWRYKADVEFKINRTPLKIGHSVLESLHGSNWQESLFPQSFNHNPKNIQLRPFFNESVAKNELQIQAIKNIVQNRAYPAPYILFGPPGTGKTATLVEAIAQIWSTMGTSRICVCASSNTAADVIAKRLLRYIPLSDVIRVYGLSRNGAEIISELQACCNYDARVKELFFPSMTELKNKRIVVMTPVTAGRFILRGITFDYIFMDEAGHALEVDVLIPISAFLRNIECSMVLAGDPQQLGPVVRSPYAIALGYGMSLLERLMTQCKIYKRDPVTGTYNPNVITKLVNNYRSHEIILRIPNQLFYDNELKAKGSKTQISSLCRWNKLPKKEFPIIFHSVKGLEERESNSPSYFNTKEIDAVEDYVVDLFNSRDLQLDQSEVGIISPYRKQVHKIRQRLQKSWPKIDVASVEEFQGQERKVIIISTVRSRRELLATDYKYGLGFLKNEKRFNVAITRAIALLIVIGNPDILQCDPNWREFLKYCTENSAFIGEPASGILPEDFDSKVNQVMYLNGFQI